MQFFQVRSGGKYPSSPSESATDFELTGVQLVNKIVKEVNV